LTDLALILSKVRAVRKGEGKPLKLTYSNVCCGEKITIGMNDQISLLYGSWPIWTKLTQTKAQLPIRVKNDLMSHRFKTKVLMLLKKA
jgi:hypothetical protein